MATTKSALPKPTFNPDHAYCKALVGHQWARKTLIIVVLKGQYHMQVRCSHCGTVRRSVIAPNGAPSKRQYLYAAGYLQPGTKREGYRELRISYVKSLLRGRSKYGS